MIKNKKFLFVIRDKLSNIEYLYNKKNLKFGTVEYKKANRKLRNFQFAWTDVIENKYIIENFSYLFDWLKHFLPYKIWLKIAKLNYFPIIRNVDSVIFNIDILSKMLIKEFNVLEYYDNRIFKITEIILTKFFNKVIIEYDGRPLSVSERNLQKDIHCDNKYLVSNMQWKDKIGFRKKNFYQIFLGVDENFARFEEKKRDIDILIVGSFNDKVFPTRCEYVDFLLKHCKDINIEIYGTYEKNKKYAFLNKIKFQRLLGEDLQNKMERTKMTLIIPSDEHLNIADGMPMRLYENAAKKVFQLIYKTNAIKNTVFIENEDFVFFDSKENMVSKIEYYLKHEQKRKKIVELAYRKFLENYTAQKSFLKLLKNIGIKND